MATLGKMLTASFQARTADGGRGVTLSQRRTVTPSHRHTVATHHLWQLHPIQARSQSAAPPAKGGKIHSKFAFLRFLFVFVFF